ncbi:MAG: GyrI-like domain-containing protein [Firmicutes bacterium]|nr:GyrI-like domain-containing protein [Bacillota bacterium]
MTKGITIKTIPSCTVYRAEYDFRSISDFFNMETGENILYDLQYMMEADNPDVKVPELGEDYNFFQLPLRKNPDGTKHIIYRDMTIGKGMDSRIGAYRFEIIPEITAATLMHRGPFETVEAAFASVVDWISANGYVVAGPGRCSAIHGPWDRDNPEDFLNEIQVPIKKED